MEICEIADHPWFLGCQFHPEFKSKPMEPHPLFKAFIGAAYANRKRRLRPSRREPTRLRVSRSTRVAIEFGDFRLRPAAGPDRRAVRDRERRARSPHGARHSRRRSANSFSKRPSTRPIAPACDAYRGPGLREGLRILAGVKAEGFSDPHRHSRAGAGRSRPPKSWTSCRFPPSSAARPTC